VRVENIKDPSDHIPALLERVKPEYLTKTYQVYPHVDPCENPCSYTDRETMEHMDENERACKKIDIQLYVYIVHMQCQEHMLYKVCTCTGAQCLNECIVHAIQP
jgi:hypothetical protein